MKIEKIVADYLHRNGVPVLAVCEGTSEYDGEIQISEQVSVQVGMCSEYYIASFYDEPNGTFMHCPVRNDSELPLLLDDVKRMLRKGLDYAVH